MISPICTEINSDWLVTTHLNSQCEVLRGTRHQTEMFLLQASECCCNRGRNEELLRGVACGRRGEAVQSLVLEGDLMETSGLASLLIRNGEARLADISSQRTRGSSWRRGPCSLLSKRTGEGHSFRNMWGILLVDFLKALRISASHKSVSGKTTAEIHARQNFIGVSATAVPCAPPVKPGWLRDCMRSQ